MWLMMYIYMGETHRSIFTRSRFHFKIWKPGKRGALEKELEGGVGEEKAGL